MYEFLGHWVYEFILFNVWIQIWQRDIVIGHGIRDPYHGATRYKLVAGVSDDGPSLSPDLTANQISDGSEDPLT